MLCTVVPRQYETKLDVFFQFVNGGNLESLLLEHTVYLDWTTRLYLARDIAEGMRYLHKNGVIHRDLTSKVRKNENCVISTRRFLTVFRSSTPANSNIFMVFFYANFFIFLQNCLIKETNGWRYAIVADLGLATEIK